MSTWRRAVVCVAAVATSAAAAFVVAALQGPRWVSAGVAGIALALVSELAWPGLVSNRWRGRPVQHGFVHASNWRAGDGTAVAWCRCGAEFRAPKLGDAHRLVLDHVAEKSSAAKRL